MTLRWTLAILLVASMAPAQDAPKPPSGRITGRVVAMDTGKPLHHALVWMVSPQGRQSAARTDAQGRYEFTALAAGTYRLDARADRYLRMHFGGQPYSGLSAAEPRGVSLRDGEVFDKADFSLPRGGAIEVRLLDEFGDPAPGLLVQLSQVEYVAGRRRLLPRATPEPPPPTDDRGFVRVHGLSPGMYYVSALSGAFAEQAETGGFAPTYYPGSADLAAATPVRLALGQELTISFPLTPARMARISGSIVDASGASTRGSVFLSSADSTGLSEFFITRGESEPDGTFVFRNVPPGKFTLQGYGAQAVQGAGNLGAYQFGWLPLVVDGEDQQGLAIRVSTGPSLKGRVTTEDVSGTPLNARDVMVTAIPVQFDSGPIGGGPPPFSIQEDGSFEVKNLSGRRLIRVSVRNPGLMLKRITRMGREITDDAVDFTKADVDGVEVVLTNRVTSVTGNVTDEKANRVTDYAVIVFATDRSKWTDRSRFIAFARSNQDGSFRIAGLPPDEYFVIALPAIQGSQWQDPDFLKGIEEAARRFLLGEGEAKTLTVKLSTVR